MRWVFVIVVILLSPVVYGMQISFFEEFPTNDSLAPLGEIDKPTTVFLASDSYHNFTRWEHSVHSTYDNVEQVVWWPTLTKEAGYWISPWTKTDALEKMFSTLENRDNKSVEVAVMLDMELPLARERLLQGPYEVIKNKKRIEAFLRNAPKHNINIYTIQITQLPTPFLEVLGLWYDPKEYNVTPIRMYYSSFRRDILPDPFVDMLFLRQLHLARQEGSIMGIGLIATGIHGDEPIYTAQDLERELSMACRAKMDKVVIFRLAGVQDKYASVINSFSCAQ